MGKSITKDVDEFMNEFIQNHNFDSGSALMLVMDGKFGSNRRTWNGNMRVLVTGHPKLLVKSIKDTMSKDKTFAEVVKHAVYEYLNPEDSETEEMDISKN